MVKLSTVGSWVVVRTIGEMRHISDEEKERLIRIVQTDTNRLTTEEKKTKLTLVSHVMEILMYGMDAFYFNFYKVKI
jgi:hypothetical protein